jgi:hypothetical protein
MFTIWYEFSSDTGYFAILKCDVEGLKLARELWDKLNSSGFRMASHRP